MIKIKTTAFLGISVAVALILSYIECLLPPISAYAPGIKLGLANIVIVFLLYRFGFLKALAVSLIRVALSAILFTGFTAFLYSLSGAILSIIIMAILRKTGVFSEIGVSVAGGIFHNLGQIIMVIILTETLSVGYYMAVLTISGTISGIIVGAAGALLINKTKNIKI
jgi:heptaprenyl diphosphate synthase